MHFKMSYKYKNSFKTWSDNNGRLGSMDRIKTGLEIVCFQKTADNTQILPEYIKQNESQKTSKQRNTRKGKEMGR